MKIALVCDWLTNVGGAEKVLLRLHQMYPEAPIYTSKYDAKGIDWFLDAEVKTGWLQVFPTFMRRFLGPLRQRWFSHLDLSEYDLVISVTGAEAKAVKTVNAQTGRRAVHISYCHVPTQYYWQMYDDYVRNPGFGVLNPLVRACFKTLVKGQRKKDFEAAQRVDEFVTISEYSRELIKKYYKREAKVVHPPVEIKDFKPVEKPVENFYVVTSRQVTWKRLDLAVKACVGLKRELLVIGEGPEHKRLVEMADDSPLVRFLPMMGAKELAEYLAQARGYLFPSLEPFGIAPVEALAAGCPVIAFHEGGALDYVQDGKNGVLFEKQTVKSLEEAMVRFEGAQFDRGLVAKTARKFAAERFEKEIREVVNEARK
ncbi:glycosyltransferase [Candidatus Saccharibacteria bacterium]|nr:glycosyltransferase [Candidatus Saccharibacteria bacterium]